MNSFNLNFNVSGDTDRISFTEPDARTFLHTGIGNSTTGNCFNNIFYLLLRYPSVKRGEVDTDRVSAYSRFTQGRKGQVGFFKLYSNYFKDLAPLAFTLMDHSV